MNVEHLFRLLEQVEAEIQADRSVTLLEQMRSALTNAINQPGQPSYQLELASARGELAGVLSSSASNQMAPLDRQVLTDVGLTPLLGLGLLQQVEAAFTGNDLTPQIALTEIGRLADEVGRALQTVGQQTAGFRYLELMTDALPTGVFELAVLIPRGAVEQELKQLGKEFQKLSVILAPFQEIAEGGSPQPLRVTAIASSDFGVFLELAPKVAEWVTNAIAFVVDTYKSVLEIRRLRQQLADQGVSESALEPVIREENEKVRVSIHDEVSRLVVELDLPKGRMSELSIALEHSYNSLALRIDDGYNFSVRTGPPPAHDAEMPEEITNAARVVADSAQTMAFLTPFGRPMLTLEEAAEVLALDEQEPPA